MKHAIVGLVVLIGAALLPAAAGDLVWSYATGGAVESSPAVSGGYVYVGSYDNNFYCLDAATGDLVWSYATGGSVFSSPAVSGGYVYVGSVDNKVYCLDAASGALVWSYATGNRVVSSPAVSCGCVFVASRDGKAYCLDADTGAFVRDWDIGADSSSPAVAGGDVYVGSGDGWMYRLTPTGSVGHQLGSRFFSSPAVSEGYVYVGNDDGNVYCLNTSWLGVEWSYPTGGLVQSSPAVSGGRVYLGSNDGNVYCLDAATGALAWSFQTGDDIVASPAVSGGYVYVANDGQNVYCFHAATGALLWGYTTGGPVISSPAVRGGHVYVVDGPGRVYCLEAGFGDPGKWPMFGHDARRSGACACASAQIGPAGGTLEVDDVSSPLNGAKVVFPPGALAAQTEVTIGETVPKAAGVGVALGEPADLGPDGVALTGPVTVYLPHAAATAHVSPVQAFWWDAGAGQWSTQGISNVVHDGSADPHVVSFDTEHFTTFQAAGTVPPAPPPAASGGDDDDDDGGFCFIATAAYGSELASEVESLKSLRDTHLMKCAAGRLFVDVYYACGRYAAEAIAESDEARACVRLALRPLVSLAAPEETAARE